MRGNMKKYFQAMIIVISVFLLTGCMKVEFSMGINKDGSMDFQIIEAFDKSMASSDSFTTDNSNFKYLENQGFYIQEYSDDEMQGYKITKSFEDINEFSKENESFVGDLNKFLEDGEGSLFTVKKGFFKNKYSAKLNVSNSSLDSSISGVEEDEYEYEYDDSYDYEDSYDEDSEFDDFNSSTSDLSDYSDMMANLEINFVVNLPYKVVSNNATNVNNNGKSLTWDLMTHQAETLDFEFELYNMTNIYIVGGGILLIVILLIVLIVKSSSKNSSTKNNNMNTNIQSNNYSVNTNANTNFNSSSSSNNVQINNNASNIDGGVVSSNTVITNSEINNSSTVENDKSFLISSSNMNNNVNSSQEANQSMFNFSSGMEVNVSNENSINMVSGDAFGIGKVEFIESSTPNSNSFISNQEFVDKLDQVSTNMQENVIPVIGSVESNNTNVMPIDNLVSQNNVVNSMPEVNVIDNNPEITNMPNQNNFFRNDSSATEPVIPVIGPVMPNNTNVMPIDNLVLQNSMVNSVPEVNVIDNNPEITNMPNQNNFFQNDSSTSEPVIPVIEPVIPNNNVTSTDVSQNNMVNSMLEVNVINNNSDSINN